MTASFSAFVVATWQVAKVIEKVSRCSSSGIPCLASKHCAWGRRRAAGLLRWRKSLICLFDDDGNAGLRY